MQSEEARPAAAVNSSGQITDPSRPARLWHGGVAFVVAVALVLQLVLVIGFPAPDAPGTAVRVLRFFSFFTVQSNILVLVTAVQLARDPARDGRLWRVVRLDALLAIAVTGVVHFVALRPIQDLSGLDAVADILLHVVSPLIAVAGWILFGPRPRVALRDVGLSVVWPLLWFGYTLVHGAISGWYPYPFVDVGDIGYARTLINAAVVTVIFLVLATGVRWLDHALRPAPRAAINA